MSNIYSVILGLFEKIGFQHVSLFENVGNDQNSFVFPLQGGSYRSLLSTTWET